MSDKAILDKAERIVASVNSFGQMEVTKNWFKQALREVKTLPGQLALVFLLDKLSRKWEI